MNETTHSTAKQPLGHQVPSGNQTTDLAAQNMEQLLLLKKLLGIEIEMFDRKLNRVCAKYNSLDQFLGNPETIGRLTQDLYVCDSSKTQWFMLSIRKGKLKSIRSVLSFHVNWINVINKPPGDPVDLIVGYSPGAGCGNTVTVVPLRDFCPERITKHFPFLIGQNANDTREIGKLLCYVLRHYVDPGGQKQTYIGKIQGFTKTPTGKIKFSPPLILHSEYQAHLPPALQIRQYPNVGGPSNEDISPVLLPLFKQKKDFQVGLLFRIASWMQFLFAMCDVYANNALLVKTTELISVLLLVALFKNTAYNDLDSPPIGPNIKPLKFALENINDGVALAIDPFAADQLKKGEKGFDLLIQDVSGANGSDSGVHHVPVLITQFADLYIPREKRCILEMNDTVTVYSPADYKTALKRLDAAMIYRLETGCNQGDLVKSFRRHIDEIRASIPASIPVSKHNTYIMLMTALQLYGEFFSPLFDEDIRAHIIKWLIAQDQDPQPLNDRICTEFGIILNRKIADGDYRLIPKEEVTPFAPGSNTIIVDTHKRQIYVHTDDSFAIAKNEMQTISDTDSLTTALYECGYLPHNSRGEKSIRITICNSDDEHQTPYFHAISFKLISRKNLQRFDLLNKQMYLFRRDEMPTEGFLPLIKTVDGRFAGILFRYEVEEQHSYFGTGRSGSGKSWAIAQLLPMLLILGQIVVVLDASGTYKRAKLLRMLPAEVVDRLFRFVQVGNGQDKIPVDLGSLKGCNSLADKKKVIYSLLVAALGKMDLDNTTDKRKKHALKLFLSDYLKNKTDSVDFTEMLIHMEQGTRIDPCDIEFLADVFAEIDEIGCDDIDWTELFERERRIIVLDLGNEVGDSSHILIDTLVASLFTWQMMHDSQFLTIVVDEAKDQNFSKNAPLRAVLTDGRKYHTALIGATQDYYDQRNPQLDAMRQASIQSFCRPGKSEDKIAEKLNYKNAADAGFPGFKPGDIIMELDALNKETGENEPVTLRGRVVDFVETPLYDRFRREYQISDPQENTAESPESFDVPQLDGAEAPADETVPEVAELPSTPLASPAPIETESKSSEVEMQQSQLTEAAVDVPAEEATAEEALPEMPRVIFIPLTPPPPDEMNLKPSSVEEQLSQSPEPANSVLETVEAVPEAESSETTKPESVEVPASDSAAAKTAEASPEIEIQPAPPESEPDEPEEAPQERIERELQTQFQDLKHCFSPDYPGWRNDLAKLFIQLMEKRHYATPRDRDKLKNRLDSFLWINPKCSDYREQLDALFKAIWPSS